MATGTVLTFGTCWRGADKSDFSEKSPAEGDLRGAASCCTAGAGNPRRNGEHIVGYVAKSVITGPPVLIAVVVSAVVIEVKTPASRCICQRRASTAPVFGRQKGRHEARAIDALSSFLSVRPFAAMIMSA